MKCILHTYNVILEQSLANKTFLFHFNNYITATDFRTLCRYLVIYVSSRISRISRIS